MKVDTVICDKCGWRKDGEDIRKWHLKPCPACGHHYIIDDEDMRIYKFFSRVMSISKLIKFFFPKVKTSAVYIDSKSIKEWKP